MRYTSYSIPSEAAKEKIEPQQEAYSEPTTEYTVAYNSPSTFPRSGLAMFYNPGVMQVVVANRVMMGDITRCSECIGEVALLNESDLNRRVWLQWANGDIEGPFLVTDVAARHHVASLLARNWVVDVDHQTAVRRGMYGPVPVTVWGAPLAQTISTAGTTAVDVQTPWPTAVNAPAQAPAVTSYPVNTAMPWLTPTSVVASTQIAWPTTAPVGTLAPWPTAVNAIVAVQAPLATAYPINTIMPWLTPTPMLVAATLVPWPGSTPVETHTPWPTAVNAAVQVPLANANAVNTNTPWPTQTPTDTPTSFPTAVNNSNTNP